MADHAGRDRVLEATMTVLARDGIHGISGRVIAAEADVSQALVFYHYGSVTDLLATAARTASARRASTYQQRLASVGTLSDLVAEARQLHREEVVNGNLAAVRQLVAAAAIDHHLRPSLQASFDQLAAPVADRIRELTAGTALEGILDPTPLARGVAGSFLGLQLLDGVVLDIEDDALLSLEQLARLGDIVLSAGVLESAVVRRRLQQVTGTGADRPR